MTPEGPRPSSQPIMLGRPRSFQSPWCGSGPLSASLRSSFETSTTYSMAFQEPLGGLAVLTKKSTQALLQNHVMAARSWHVPLILVPGRQKEMDLVYRVSSRPSQE